MTEGPDWRSRLAEDARRYQELRERLDALSISAKSRDGAVRVTVSASGHLTGLEFAEAARSMSLADLAARVMDSVHQAQSRLPDLLRQTMTETVGPVDHLLVDEARKRFPEPEPPAGPRAWQPDEVQVSKSDTAARPPAASPRPARSPRPRRGREEIWDDERPILEDV